MLDTLLQTGNIGAYHLIEWPDKHVAKLAARLRADRVDVTVEYDATPITSTLRDGTVKQDAAGTLTIRHARGRYTFLVTDACLIADAPPPPYFPDAWVGQRLSDPFCWGGAHWTSDGRHVWRSNGVTFLWSSVNVPPSGSGDGGTLPPPLGFLARLLTNATGTATFGAVRGDMTRTIPRRGFVTLTVAADGVTVSTDASIVPMQTGPTLHTGSMCIDAAHLYPVLNALHRDTECVITIIDADGGGYLWINAGPYDALIAGYLP